MEHARSRQCGRVVWHKLNTFWLRIRLQKRLCKLISRFLNAPLSAWARTKATKPKPFAFLASFTDALQMKCPTAWATNQRHHGWCLMEDDILYNVSLFIVPRRTVRRAEKSTSHRMSAVIESIQGGNETARLLTRRWTRWYLNLLWVEFPELGRFLTQQDMDILFGSFWTWHKKIGYLRVRPFCASTRHWKRMLIGGIFCGAVATFPKLKTWTFKYSHKGGKFCLFHVRFLLRTMRSWRNDKPNMKWSCSQILI